MYCRVVYTFRNAFFMTNLTAAAVLLGLREICAVSGLANSVTSCLFMQRCCFNRRSTRHSEQNHSLLQGSLIKAAKS